jgi:predicted transcriptional regulator
MKLKAFASIVSVIASQKNFNVSKIASDFRFDFNQVKEVVKILEKNKFIKPLDKEKTTYEVR